MLSPSERSLRGRIGALKLHASGKTNTAAARSAFDQRFYADVPADLPEAERDRRAALARRAYFAQLSYRSARARSKRAPAETA